MSEEAPLVLPDRETLAWKRSRVFAAVNRDKRIVFAYVQSDVEREMTVIGGETEAKFFIRSETIYPQFVKDSFVTATNVVKSSAQVVGAALAEVCNSSLRANQSFQARELVLLLAFTVCRDDTWCTSPGGAVAGGVNAVGGAVSNTAGAVTSFVPTPPTFNAAPARWGAHEPSLEERTKADIAGWLEKMKLDSLQADFASAEVDGAALAAMVQTWDSDKLGIAARQPVTSQSDL
eukprot:762521-Hanusia_phi.AAC.25